MSTKRPLAGSGLGAPASVSLAPMEGVIDEPMRTMLTGIGGYDRCVTEFVRVTDVLLPERVFFRLCPELASGGVTPSGVPVFVQLLGSDADALAVNARRAVELGAPGVDLNFGCPAKTVNNSMGGSILLREPARVADIVRRVRQAVPSEFPVTAKIRLGYNHADDLAELVQGIHASGADQLTIHARTRLDGYKPPAHWSLVHPVLSLGGPQTLINGEIWTVEDGHQARMSSGCDHLMLGRGALAAPDLAERISSDQLDAEPMPWREVIDKVEAWFLQHDRSSPRHTGNRTKQWLGYLRRNYAGAPLLFERLRRSHSVEGICSAFAEHRRVDLPQLDSR